MTNFLPKAVLIGKSSKKNQNIAATTKTNGTFQFSITDHSRLAGQAPVNGSPRSSIRSNHSSKPATPPPNTNRGGTIILDSLSVSPKAKLKEPENNNSSKIVNKNSSNANASKMQQQMLQQLVDQQSVEKQKQLAELTHANKGVEALGVLVQYLVFNVSIDRNTRRGTMKFNDQCTSNDEELENHLEMLP